MIEIGKLYLVLDKNNVIKKFFIQNTAKPESGKWYKKGCNFDESKDFENAIIVEPTELNKIEVNKSQFINGKVVANGTI